MTAPDVLVRLATDQDADAVVDVCASALGWSDPTFDRALFAWKHFSNAFGRSIIVVAEGTNGLLAVRPLMQWRFVDGRETVRAARAVDTATLPEAQGRGLFRTLTEAGLRELADRDYAFVFNTPNDQSRPGYLKMGWEDVGPISFGFGLSRPTSLVRIARSRTAAEKPSIPTPNLGVDVAVGLASADLEYPRADDGRRRTAHSLDTLTWRYCRGPISYRWLATSESGGCVVRLRRRGHSRELLVAQLVGRTSAASAWEAVREAMRTSEADYCLAPAGFGATRTIRRLGPSLALRKVGEVPSADMFAWTPGDIELF